MFIKLVYYLLHGYELNFYLTRFTVYLLFSGIGDTKPPVLQSSRTDMLKLTP